MTKELIIHSQGAEINIALMEDGRLVELNQDREGAGFSVGDIYIGRVRKIMGGLNAAFVNVGYEKDAFIHHLDLGGAYNNYAKLAKQIGRKGGTIDISHERLYPDIKRDGRIGNHLKSGDLMMVQIAKEPISTKGPRLSGDISLPGRHLVLIPFTNKIHISQKVKSNSERKRLRTIVETMLPKNFGAIVRTAAQGKDQIDIENDITDLLGKWSTVMSNLRMAQVPCKLLGEENRTTTILRDLLNDSFSAIHTDNEAIYNEVRDYISAIEPDAEKIVKMYRGTVPIFDNFDVTKQIKQNFGKTVPFKRGAYLIVEHTEALHVIDVNSGRRSKSDENQEQNALEVNLNAVSEVARQLRLKDMGGIIVIDFIDLHNATNRNTVLKAMEQAMSTDRAKHTILPLTKFGLMQITRQRVRPERKISINEVCPTCRGTGEISPTILLDQQIENQIAYFTREKHLKILKLHLHPYVASYLTKGLLSIRRRWALKYRISLKIIPNDSLGMIDFKFYNSIGDELKEA